MFSLAVIRKITLDRSGLCKVFTVPIFVHSNFLQNCYKQFESRFFNNNKDLCNKRAQTLTYLLSVAIEWTVPKSAQGLPLLFVFLIFRSKRRKLVNFSTKVFFQSERWNIPSKCRKLCSQNATSSLSISPTNAYFLQWRLQLSFEINAKWIFSVYFCTGLLSVKLKKLCCRITFAQNCSRHNS